MAYERYGPQMRKCIAGFNRPMFANDLATEWLPALPDLNARLTAAESARVLDVACGTGWSTICLARAYQNVTVTGIDLDAASIDQARRNATGSGVADRVRFEVSDAAGTATDGGYQLAMLFEALHDMGDPVGALRQVRAALAESAPLLVADERVTNRATSPVVANGTVRRSTTVRQWASEAGFSRVEELPIAHDFWRFYRLEG